MDRAVAAGKTVGSQAPFLLGLSALVVFLCLARSTRAGPSPLAVLLTVPARDLRAVAATLRGIAERCLFHRRPDHDHRVGQGRHFIIEFAKDLRAQGKPLIEATVEACALRFRPILMTGSLSLRRAADGGDDRRRRRGQQALGTSVHGGMIAVWFWRC